MADPLSLLQMYHDKTDQIKTHSEHIIFGNLAWPKDVQTSYRIYGTEKDGKWEYYTLDCLLYFLKNIKRSHPDYVKQAKGEVQIVRRPDRRDLVSFLEGHTQKKDVRSIDQSAPLQMPTQTHTLKDKEYQPSSAKRARLDAEHHHEPMDHQTSGESAQAQEASAHHENEEMAIGAEKPITEIMKKKLDLSGNNEGGKLTINKENLKNLSEDLNKDKIAELRAKFISNRRTRIKAGEDEGEVADKEPKDHHQPHQVMSDLSISKEAKDIFGRERVWRTRATVLQSSGKTFSKTVNAILAGVKAREDGKLGIKRQQQNPQMRPHNANMNPMNPHHHQQQQQQQPRNLPNYNRYDQEQFRAKDDTHGFNIETTGTFSGMTLKSVTEGNNPANKSKSAPNSKPAPKNPSSNTPGKRPSKTPIIIIPAAPKSLISMYNAKDILQDLRFMSTEDKKATGSRRENELLIQRRKEGGLTVPYRVIDNPNKLTNADWDRVVACFVMGQAWQFKGWPWGGNPTDIFAKIAAYHIKWDDSTLEKNIGNWSVHVIPLSRDKRHLDRAKLMLFWETLDKYMVNNKPHLRF